MTTRKEKTLDPAMFGIVGNFTGDEKLWEQVQACQQAYRVKSTPKPPLARLVVLLGRLPHVGRKAVVREILAPSPHRDAVLNDLFEYCFEAGPAPTDDGEDDDDDDDVKMEDVGDKKDLMEINDNEDKDDDDEEE